MRNRKVMRTAVLTIGIAMSVFAAPLANAAPSGPTCSATALSTLCQSPGNAQVVARPPVVDYQAQLPYYGGYGFYPFGIGRMHR